MIKVISIIVLIVALYSSWSIMHTADSLNIAVHAGIQSQLSILIEDTIKAKKPNMTRFKLIKMYTQKIDDTKVSAHFSYEYDEAAADSNEDSSTRKISGQALLVRTLSENMKVQRWQIQSIKTGSEEVSFKQGLLVEAKKNSAESQPTAEDEEKKTE